MDEAAPEGTKWTLRDHLSRERYSSLESRRRCHGRQYGFSYRDPKAQSIRHNAGPIAQRHHRRGRYGNPTTSAWPGPSGFVGRPGPSSSFYPIKPANHGLCWKMVSRSGTNGRTSEWIGRYQAPSRRTTLGLTRVRNNVDPFVLSSAPKRASLVRCLS